MCNKLINSLLLIGLSLLVCTSLLAEEWPRQIQNEDGSKLVINKQPQRVLSTSVTVTGTLLAINAPVVASAAATTDAFFAQWADVANARQVKKLWPAGRIDFEAAYEVEPDLIIVSAVGADSALAHIDMLRAIAPVMVVDYAKSDWQTLARQLGIALGLERQVETKIAAFNQRVEQVKASLQLPSGKANIVSYNGPGIINPIGTATGTHGQLLASLGFILESPQASWFDGKPISGDFVRTEYEQLTELRAETTFLLRRHVDDTSAFTKDVILQNLPSVQRNQVWGLGKNSFRMDYYSASETVDIISQLFAVK